MTKLLVNFTRKIVHLLWLIIMSDCLVRILVWWHHWVVKDKCYANHPKTIEALKQAIKVAMHGIEAQTTENVLKNWIDRMGYCKASRGSHLNDVMFHSQMERLNHFNKTILLKKYP